MCNGWCRAREDGRRSFNARGAGGSGSVRWGTLGLDKRCLRKGRGKADVVLWRRRLVARRQPGVTQFVACSNALQDAAAAQQRKTRAQKRRGAEHGLRMRARHAGVGSLTSLDASVRSSSFLLPSGPRVSRVRHAPVLGGVCGASCNAACFPWADESCSCHGGAVIKVASDGSDNAFRTSWDGLLTSFFSCRLHCNLRSAWLRQ